MLRKKYNNSTTSFEHDIATEDIKPVLYKNFIKKLINKLKFDPCESIAIYRS
ncbi:MAG: hypothetical protein Tsb0015_16690 [Simkaniaceae bacterium]